MTLLDLIQTYPGYVDATNPTDQVILDFLNESVGRNKTSLSGDELFNAADTTEQNALTPAERSEWLSLCGRDNIDPFGAANVALVVQLFGGGSTTVTALNALRVEQVDRVTAAGISRKNLGVSLVNSVRAA